MKTRAVQITALIVVILVVGALVLLASRRSKGANASADAAPDDYKLNGDCIEVNNDAMRTAGIQTMRLATSDVPMTLRLTGRTGLNMETVTHVHAQFGGKVVNVEPELGAAVKGPETGHPTVLCVIESNDLAQGKAAFLQARIQLKLDQDALRRTQELVAAKVLAEKFLIDAESAVTKDAASMEAARQQLMIFGLTPSEIDQIDKQVGRQRMDYVITSPRTGVIAEKGVAGGEIADPTLNLFTVADTHTLWVWGDVYERDLPKVKVGEPMRIYFTSEPDQPRSSRIDWISPVLDPNTHSVKIRAVLDNSDGRLLSDMYGTMVVTVSDGKNSLIVPADAVINNQNSAYVFVRTSDSGGRSVFRRSAVRIEPLDLGFGAEPVVAAATQPDLSARTASRLRIVEGIKSGDVIVSSGALGLSNEMDQQAKGL